MVPPSRRGRFASHCGSGWHDRPQINAPRCGPRGWRGYPQAEIAARIDKERIGGKVARTKIHDRSGPIANGVVDPSGRDQTIVHLKLCYKGRITTVTLIHIFKYPLGDVVEDIAVEVGPLALWVTTRNEEFEGRVEGRTLVVLDPRDGVVLKIHVGTGFQIDDMIDVIEHISYDHHDGVKAVIAGRYDIGIAGAGVVSILVNMLEAIALDPCVSTQIQAFVTAAHERVVKDLENGTRKRGSGKINNVVMPLVGSKEVVLDDKVSSRREYPWH